MTIKNSPVVTILCPVFNGENYIKTTVDSVFSQDYKLIEFIVIDGKSTDKTLEILNDYNDAGFDIKIVSEADYGMYDALTKGFSLARGELICYINSGDFLNSYAISTAVEIFKDESIDWITGLRSKCNDSGQVTYVDTPFRYKKSLIECGSYLGKLPYIQQESTLWRRSLMDKVNLAKLRKFSLAGDYYIWLCLNKVATLRVVSCPFGVFRKHPNQLSENLFAYRTEINPYLRKRNIFDCFQEFYELLFWMMEPRLRACILRTVIEYDYKKGKWSDAD
jgi:glycosyltransferase involved in cell wall biosynthesis